MKRTVVIGFLGTQLDGGRGAGRWDKWRPSVALTRQPDALVHRFELLYSDPHRPLADLIAADIAQVSPETEVVLRAMSIADPWDFEAVYAALHDFARAYPFDTDHEDYWVHITTGTHVVQICLFLMTEARYFPGKLLQTAPPARQRERAAGSYALIDLDLSRYDRIAERFRREQRDALDVLKSGIATRNPRFNRMIEEIERVAIASRAPILLMGPTGAGKSFLARRIFELKKSRHRFDGGFVEVNCATLRGDTLGSALFGHVKGAFTGAAADRAGLLRSAHRGLLFLDEIGELGADEQAMLLKAVEEKRFYPVGSDREVAVDFQLIAGTNRDLRVEVAAGRFREDLYARINLWSYALPGLAERAEDIAPNLDFLLARLADEEGRKVRFGTEARERYLAFAAGREARWPGNFRDLAASVQRMATLAPAGRITLEVVADEIERLRRTGSPAAPAGPDPLARLGAERLATLDLFDRMQLESVLAVCAECRSLSEAGRRLFAASRAAKANPNDADRLRKYLARHGLAWDDLRR